MAAPPCFSTASNSLREAFTHLPWARRSFSVSFSHFPIFFLPLWFSSSATCSSFLPCFFCSLCAFPRSFGQCLSCLWDGKLPAGVQDGKHPASLGILPISIDVLLPHGTSPVFCSVTGASCPASCQIEFFFFTFHFSAAFSMAAKPVICDCGRHSSHFSP